MKLSARLAMLADCVPQDAVLADIGTDHAYLPVSLVESGRIGRAIAGDVVSGPYQAAQKAVAAAGYEAEISVRLGNGLAVLRPGEADTVVIAGMGGATIVEILAAEPEITAELKRLILQPMIAAGQVRRWLRDNCWRIVEEELVEDSGRIYEVIVAEQGMSEKEEEILEEIGPLLWRKRHPLLRRQLEAYISQTQMVIAQLAQSTTLASREKYAEYEKRLQELEAKLECL